MASDGQIVQIDGRRLRVTNLDKVVYPETGTTKGEIIAYYSTIAPQLLPLLAGRPVTRKRWVEGVGTADAPADAFFTKQLERGAPEWIPRQEIQHSDGAKEYPLVQDVPTLVWLAQVAAIELHVPQWRFTAEGLPGRPDRLVLDLDPGPGVDLVQCAAVARIARGILTGMGLDPLPVTSGSKGIHLYAALPGEQTSDEISAVVKQLARLIEDEHPDLATATMSKAVRGGRVFLDWSQNNGKKTTISPYSLRGRARPWVAAPRTWEELDDPDLAQLEIDAVLARAAAGIDPLAGLRGEAPATAPPIAPRHPHRYPRASAAVASAAQKPTLSPMLAENGTPALARSLSTPSWVEVKWDGIRAVGTWSHGRMLLHARSGTDITARYPELTADGAPFLPASDAVVDGEIVAFDDHGRPSFSLLQNRMHLTRPREIEREVVRTPIVYLLFDLIRLDGHDLTDMPLRQRRTLLQDLAEELDAPVKVPPVFDDVDAALAASREFGLEGVVAKDPSSRYRPGQRSPSWLKVKHTLMQEAVIVGIRPGKGDRESTLGSLLLAVRDSAGGALRYVGRVGTGFTERSLRDLLARLEPLRIDSAPLNGVPALDAADALWVRPELVGEVEFANWTPDGVLRHARWRGLRPDKAAEDVVREA
ncbi:non-homologous end-joining DNA ligase [Microbacterium sp. SSW1-49]|uniref:DNA ligase (ATP) n=1 Tax=Microbacterium croceum TaxID=2851645 RepID=A0ABT0FHP1_9MICO|nr:non-homologous end-joining DNA ligase [Microbacterium croceum]MCK2037306.1 non-homologous end-joining DNA ligase [Microbacterium croceum]